MEYPPLPTIPGVGEVPYHAVCDFETRAVHLWPPADLRRWLQCRQVQARPQHQMDTYVDDSSGEVVDGLVDLVVSLLAMAPQERPQPLSQANAETFGHVDPTMWEVVDEAERPSLTLEDNMAEILELVKTLRITSSTIEDRWGAWYVRGERGH